MKKTKFFPILILTFCSQIFAINSSSGESSFCSKFEDDSSSSEIATEPSTVFESKTLSISGEIYNDEAFFDERCYECKRICRRRDLSIMESNNPDDCYWPIFVCKDCITECKKCNRVFLKSEKKYVLCLQCNLQNCSQRGNGTNQDNKKRVLDSNPKSRGNNNKRSGCPKSRRLNTCNSKFQQTKLENFFEAKTSK